ncbi:GGDEF domain-containing protein [Vibrio alfacsensis]|uniref:GGDEF domain-containing protein n=1 Tax=Vibrio alfacsensis TaxID=1074311 RepID=UPI002ADE9111|nr:GGDEF domain-containing protein [Vibrio alfacsensis]WQE77701.1 GGDEF domain-containing protein [Vibrio alfacsensis]
MANLNTLSPGPISTRSKALLVTFALALLLANIALLKETRALTQTYSNQQNQATWFLFHLSKELSELVGEARRLNESVINIDSTVLQYELAWSRFDLLINNKEADSFLSREEVRHYFISLFDKFIQLEPILVEAKTGSSVAANQFYRATQNLYLEMIDYVTLNFRVASPLYEQQQQKAYQLLQAQYILLGIFVLSVAMLTYFYQRESKFHRKQALSDPLTNLANRSALFIDLHQREKSSTPFSLLLLDLNGFKDINDTMGHQIGDQVLIEVSDRLRHMALDDFRVYRMGGDEFAILVNMSKQEEIDEVAHHINAVFEKPIQHSQYVRHLSTSFGVARYPHDADNIDFLINIADKRMYKMKFQR